MKFLILLFVGFSFSASAGVNVIFGKGNSKGTVLLNGGSSDVQAMRFYGSLAVPEEDFNGKWSKKFIFTDASGAKILTAACVFSKMIKEIGTCTITVYPSEGVIIDSSRGLIAYDAPSVTEAARSGMGFVIPSGGGTVFATDDGKFRVESTVDASGAVTALSVRYQ